MPVEMVRFFRDRRSLELTGVQNLDAHFIGLRRRDLDVLELERLSSSPADSSLALNDLSCGVRHGSERTSGQEI